MDGYRIPTRQAHAEFTEKRSRFIGHIFPVESEEQALANLKKMREEYWDANHNVFAYVIKDGPTRFSDDAEPQGTAGMPVLEVLRRREVYDVLCVVTRYFGGILLGAGGLVRAYAKGAAMGLEASGLSMKRVWSHVDIPCPYSLFERVRLAVQRHGGLVPDVEYGAEVLLRAMLPASDAERFLVDLADLTNGAVAGTVAGQEYRAFPVDLR